MESLDPSAELVRRPTTMLKILYFSGAYQFFQISPGIKFIYDRGRKHYLAEEAHFGTGEVILENL